MMRRDIQAVLERWGGWAARGNSGVEWQPIAAGFQGLVPLSFSQRPSCTDDDGLIIDNCIARLATVGKHEERDILVLNYVCGCSQRDIARITGAHRSAVERSLQRAENFVEGCLAMLGMSLEMDIVREKTCGEPETYDIM